MRHQRLVTGVVVGAVGAYAISLMPQPWHGWTSNVLMVAAVTYLIWRNIKSGQYRWRG